MTTTCRILTLADYDAAFALYQVLSTGATLPDQATAKDSLSAILAHRGTAIWGAQTVTGDLVSMATLHVLPNMTYGGRPYALVENVATLPSHQGQGYARAVMAAVAQAAAVARAYKIMLLTNQARGAKGFYERLGYVADEKHGMILRL